MGQDRDIRPDRYGSGVALIPAVLGIWLAYRGIDILQSTQQCEVIGHYGKYCVPTAVLGPTLLIGAALALLCAALQYRRGRRSRPRE
jgi:hypothetical protein